MFKRILLTLDGSRLSEAALPHVAELAAGTNAEVTLLMVADNLAPIGGAVHVEPGRVFDITGAGTGTEAILEIPTVIREGETHPQAEERLKDELDTYLREKAGALAGGSSRTATAVLFGDAAEQIVEYAEREGIDLIAMATHGRSGLARLVSGSVASRVVEHAGRPVMLVRPLNLPR